MRRMNRNELPGYALGLGAQHRREPERGRYGLT